MWDFRYDLPEYIFGEEPREWLVMNRHRILASGTVIALGDGDGRNGVFMAQQGLRVISVDQSAVGLNKAVKLAEKKCVTIGTKCADLASYTIRPDSVDVIISTYCHLPEKIR